MKAVHWLLAFGIVACCAVSLAIRHWPVPPSADGDELVALTAEAARLREATDDAVAAWRQKVAVPTRTGWNSERLAQFHKAFGEPWHCAWQDREAGFRSGLISWDNAPLEAWQEILGRAQFLEAQPGLAIEKVEITVAGNGAQRRFTRIAFTVRIALADQGNAARPASLGARPVSPVAEPAGSRAAEGDAPALRVETGPAPSRRARPSSRRAPAPREWRQFSV